MALSPSDQQRANVIRALIAYHDVTGSGLSHVIGCSRTSMSRKLQGEQPFTVDEIVAIAEHFDIDPRLLLQPRRLAEVFGAPDLNGRNPACVTEDEEWAPPVNQSTGARSAA